MAMEITQFLLCAQLPDAEVRNAAENHLNQYRDQNFPGFLLSLSTELSSDRKPTKTRRLAGIVLKNSLDAKEALRKKQLVQKWVAIDVATKSKIKGLLLNTLGSSVVEASHTSAQVVAKIASIEVPRKEWPELFNSLLANMTQSDRPALLKQATLETLGYICEEISNEDLMEEEVNHVLTAVVKGMNVTENTPEVRLAATRALYNTLDSSALHSHFIQKFIKKALPTLVPLLLETLLKQDEDVDQSDGTWNLAMSGGTCLGLVARTVGDDIVPLAMPFVQNNISKPDWISREAATYAFGSILEGPGIEKLAPMVNSGLEFLLNAMKDENSHVKDTTAWTLSRIFELLHSPASGFSVVTPANLQKILEVLLESIKDVPHVAVKVGGAIYFLAQGYEDAGASTSFFTPYVPTILNSLIVTADRTDVSDSKLRSASYETLNEVVRCSNISETAQSISDILPLLMTKLDQTLKLQFVSLDDREKQGDLQALLCGVLQVITQKLSSEDTTKQIILPVADQLMALFITMLACCSSTVHEEAMLAIGALAYATGPEFGKYMSEFYKYLEMGLQNFKEYEVCAISVGVVGDICRALDDKILPYCDGIMKLLFKDLSSGELHRSVGPVIFSAFGDIARAIGYQFENYINDALPLMQSASEVCAQIDNSDEEMVDYGNQLRRSLYKAYSGILQGIKNSKAQLITPNVPHLLKFIDFVANHQPRDVTVSKAALAVLGDLAGALGSNVQDLCNDCSNCIKLLGECLHSDDDQLKATATLIKGMIERALPVSG